MPIFEFQCKSCSAKAEKIMKRSEVDEFLAHNSCTCGGEIKKLISAHAYTPSLFGDMTGKFGVNGVFDPGLGRHVQNERHRDQILKQKGLVRESDMGRNFIEDWTEKRKAQKAPQLEFQRRYEAALDAGKTKEQAVVEAAPAHEILNS